MRNGTKSSYIYRSVQISNQILFNCSARAMLLEHLYPKLIKFSRRKRGCATISSILKSLGVTYNLIPKVNPNGGYVNDFVR